MNKIYFIGAGPGDPELITLKGKRLLGEADIVVYAGSLINPAVLRDTKAELYDSSKLNLSQIIEIMEKAYRADKRVVRLHSGDPSIFGALKEQMQRLDGLGIPYEVIPGVSSAMAAAAALKTELTLPEISQTVIITRHGGRTPVPEKERLRELARPRATMLVFLSVNMIDEVVAELLSEYPEDTPVAVVEKATWPEERIIHGTLKDIAQKIKRADIKKTAIIAVGDVLRKNKLKAVSKIYDKDFSHGYRK